MLPEIFTQAGQSARQEQIDKRTRMKITLITTEIRLRMQISKIQDPKYVARNFHYISATECLTFRSTNRSAQESSGTGIEECTNSLVRTKTT